MLLPFQPYYPLVVPCTHVIRIMHTYKPTVKFSINSNRTRSLFSGLAFIIEVMHTLVEGLPIGPTFYSPSAAVELCSSDRPRLVVVIYSLVN